MIGIDPRTIQRWRKRLGGGDLRAGPKKAPRNKLSAKEKARLLEIATSPEMRDLSAKQIVIRLADRGIYHASESTIYRLLKKHEQSAHRSAARARSRRRPVEKVATGPNQIWSWDITWLPRADGHGHFFLYAIMDVWSRKLVGYSVESRECSLYAADLIRRTHSREQVSGPLVLHSDNGSPMKAVKLSQELTLLGITTSFSRPRVSNDNPFSESLFRSLCSCSLWP